MPGPVVRPRGGMPRGARLVERPRVRRATALWLLLFAVYAAGAGLHASPGEDLSEAEAHYLLLTRSIVDDGNLDLSDEYGAAAWRPFYGRQLLPLTGPRERRPPGPSPPRLPPPCPAP